MGPAVKYLRTAAQIEFSITRILKRFELPIPSVAAGIWTYKCLESRWRRVVLVGTLVVLVLNYGLWPFVFTYF